MNFKVLAVVFGTLLAVQASYQSPALRDDDTKAIIVALLTKGINLSKELLEKVDGLVDDLEKNQDEIEAKIVAKAIEQGKKLNAQFLALLNKLRDGATDDGEAVLDCIVAQQDQTDAAFEQTAADIGKCAAGENTLVIAGLKDVLSQLSQLITDAEAPVTALSACSDNDLTCLLAFATSEYAVLQKIPPVITEDLEKLKELIHTITSDVSECSANIISGFESSAQDIFNSAVKCIKK